MRQRGQNCMESIEISSVSGKKIRAQERVGQPGVGMLRTAEYPEGRCLVKWFTKEDLAQTGCGTQLYQNLLEHFSAETPGSAFMWPSDVSRLDRGAFCYTINEDVTPYISLSDLMEDKGNYEGWSAIVNAALSLITAFLQMKESGYHYLHMTEDDVWIHPKTGRVLLANAEFLRKESKAAGSGAAKAGAGQAGTAKAAGTDSWMPSRRGRMLPPAYLTGGRAPDSQSDDYMLAVLLFEVLYLHHPLEGYRAASFPVMDQKAEQLVYGQQPCFIYDEKDESNGPVRGIHINVLRRWGLYPDFIRDFFTRAFRQEVLKGREPAVTAMEWYHQFMKLRSYIVPCTCGMENIWQPGEQKCRRCRTPLAQAALHYQIGTESYPVLPGTRLYQCQLDSGSDYTAVAGEFIRTKSNSSLCLLQNVTDQEWIVTDPGGQERPAGPQETVMLVDQMKITIGKATMIIGPDYT